MTAMAIMHPESVATSDVELYEELKESELYFVELLDCVEQMVRHKRTGEWRFRPYVSKLTAQYNILQKLQQVGMNISGMADYDRRMQPILLSIDSGKPESREDNSQATVVSGSKSTEKSVTFSESPVEAIIPRINDNADISLRNRRHVNKTDANQSETYEVPQLPSKRSAISDADAREQLLGSQTAPGAAEMGESGVAALVDGHRKMQEKITDNMLGLVSDLKSQSLVARDMIMRDTEKLSTAHAKMDTNLGNLSTTSVRLKKLSDNIGYWCYIFILWAAFAIFINMVLLIKFFPKKY